MGRFRRRNGRRADKQGPTGLSAIARRATAGMESNALEFLVRGRVAKSMMADVRALRERLGLTQNQFSGMIGVSIKTLLNWE